MQEILNAIGDFWNGIVSIFGFFADALKTLISIAIDFKALIHPEFDFLRIITGGMAPAMSALCLFVLGFCMATLVLRLLR